MIHEILPLIAAELSDFLDSRFDTSEDPVTLSNLVNQDGTVAVKGENKIVVSVVNIERDGSNLMAGGGFTRGDMPVHVNLYVMFSAYFNDYFEALKFISGVIGFFQGSPSFTYLGTTVKAELHNIDFRELGNLWTALGAKSLPFVIYKIRTLDMDEDNIRDVIPPVSGVSF